MITEEHEISLTNLAGGAAVELFDQELKTVLENIANVNRERKFKRQIKLTVTFEPGESAGVLIIKVIPETKLAGRQVVTTTAMYGRDSLTGKVEARELAGQQAQLPGFEDQKPIMQKKFDA